MVKEEKDIADVQIRISKKTLEEIEKHGIYSDKNPEGILKRVLPEYGILKETCPIAKNPEKKEVPIESETKTEEKAESKKEESSEEPEKTPEEIEKPNPPEEAETSEPPEPSESSDGSSESKSVKK